MILNASSSNSIFFFSLFLICSLSVQLRLWPTSIRRGSSTEIWSQKTLCCSRERREWVKDPVNPLVMTNTPKPLQRGHITGCLWAGYVELVQETRLFLIHMHWIFNVENSVLLLTLMGTFGFALLLPSSLAFPYFVHCVTYQIVLQLAVGHRKMNNVA